MELWGVNSMESTTGEDGRGEQVLISRFNVMDLLEQETKACMC